MRVLAIKAKIKVSKKEVAAVSMAGMSRFMGIVSGDFKETCKTFKAKDKPKFKPRVRNSAGKTTGKVTTTKKIYFYLSRGTKRHYISPKKAKALRFKTQYKRKTATNRISARSGGASGSYAYSKGHWVKGIDAIGFDKKIKKLREGTFVRIMGEALDDLLEI